MAKGYTTRQLKPEVENQETPVIKRLFNFPTLGVSVEAATLEEALKLAKDKVKKDDNINN